MIPSHLAPVLPPIPILIAKIYAWAVLVHLSGVQVKDNAKNVIVIPFWIRKLWPA